jgi:hypothetical protein
MKNGNELAILELHRFSRRGVDSALQEEWFMDE